MNKNYYYKHYFKNAISVIFFFILISNVYSASCKSQSHEKEKNFIMEHITDSHEWHFATIGHFHLTLPLPIILYKKNFGFDFFLSNKLKDSYHAKVDYRGYYINYNNKIKSRDGYKILDFSITKNILSMFLSILIMLVVFLLFAQKYQNETQIKGFWVFLELILLFVRDEIAIPNIGKRYYRKFMPYLLTVFFFILLNNIMGLLPGAANVTGNISITLTLAAFTFFITNINANRYYWKHLFSIKGVPKMIMPVLTPVEILGLFTKPFSLMIRLFANITAGHIILLSIINLIFIFKTSLAGFISVPFGTFMLGLKILVAFLQAYVFTLMSAIYFGNAVEESH